MQIDRHYHVCHTVSPSIAYIRISLGRRTRIGETSRERSVKPSVHPPPVLRVAYARPPFVAPLQSTHSYLDPRRQAAWPSCSPKQPAAIATLPLPILPPLTPRSAPSATASTLPVTASTVSNSCTRPSLLPSGPAPSLYDGGLAMECARAL